jgi:hypothetical protein
MYFAFVCVRLKRLVPNDVSSVSGYGIDHIIVLQLR